MQIGPISQAEFLHVVSAKEVDEARGCAEGHFPVWDPYIFAVGCKVARLLRIYSYNSVACLLCLGEDTHISYTDHLHLINS